MKLEAGVRTAEDETIYSIQMTEAQIADLASGFVPSAVKALCLGALDWADEDRRKAARPYPGDAPKPRTKR
jgi:hypothetical protein